MSSDAKRAVPSPAICSPLFVPATKPALIPKALASEADAVIVDLEDAVAHDRKNEAREELARFLQHNPGARLHVRINAPDSNEFAADLALCERYEGISTIMLPKAASREMIDRVAQLGKPIWPLLESPAGLVALATFVHAPGIERIAFGALDLAFSANLNPESEGGRAMLDYARKTLLMHSHAAGLIPPLESVFSDLGDTTRLASTASYARDMGFGGMLCIHPLQVPVVRTSFRPSDKELAWAKRIVEVSDSAQGAFKLDGEMIDAPVIARAKRILQRT